MNKYISSKVPVLFSKVRGFEGVNLDYGSSKFDSVSQFLKREYDCVNLRYNPNLISPFENKFTLKRISESKVCTVTACNVLNLLSTDEMIYDAVLKISKSLSDKGTAYFQIYEGDRSGNGKMMQYDVWQNNKKSDYYVPFISKYFNSVTRHANIIIAKQPIDNDYRVSWSIGNGENFEF